MKSFLSSITKIDGGAIRTYLPFQSFLVDSWTFSQLIGCLLEATKQRKILQTAVSETRMGVETQIVQF